jgi:hypothetical protein
MIDDCQRPQWAFTTLVSKNLEDFVGVSTYDCDSLIPNLKSLENDGFVTLIYSCTPIRTDCPLVPLSNVSTSWRTYL